MQFNRVAVSALLVALMSGCVSQSTLVETNRIAQPRTDMTEAARTRMSLGLNYLQRGDTSQAKYNLEKASQLAPDLAEIDNAIAYYYQQVGEAELAEKSYRQSLRKDGDNPDTLNNFGVFLCQLQKYQEATSLLQKAIKNPGYIRVADSYENLAFCAVAQQQYPQYQQYLRQSLAHNGNRVSAVYLMAEFSYASSDLAEAKKWSSRLEQLGERSAPASLLQYLLARQTGDVVAQQSAEKFLTTVHPQSEESLMLHQQDLAQSRPEKLRQAYQTSLLQTGAGISPAMSSARPKLKVIKRKVPATASAGQLQHQVQDGETLFSIASQYRLTVSELQQLNQLADTAVVTAGQQLQLPVVKQPAGQLAAPASYRVQEGDTLFSIAYKFNLELASLLQWNQMTAATQLTSGQTIILRDPALSSL
jgi:type IV pilus assembly protein PilF